MKILKNIKVLTYEILLQYLQMIGGDSSSRSSRDDDEEITSMG